MEKGNYYRKKVLHEIARLIKTNPISVAEALKSSGSFIENPYNKRELVDKVAYSIVNNESFRYSIAILIANNSSEYLNIGGGIDAGKEAKYGGSAIAQGISGGTQSGGWIGAIVGGVVGAIDAGFHWGTSSKKAKSEEEKAKAILVGELFEEETQKDIIPVIIIGSVLLVGAVVTFLALKE